MAGHKLSNNIIIASCLETVNNQLKEAQTLYHGGKEAANLKRKIDQLKSLEKNAMDDGDVERAGRTKAKRIRYEDELYDLI